MAEAIVKTGPQFSMGEDGVLMFSHVVDNTATIGPRPATAEDKAAYPQALAAYEAEGGEVPEGEEPAAADAPDAQPPLFQIPEDWKEGDAASRKELASKLAGREINTAAEADMLIRAELDKQADNRWP